MIQANELRVGNWLFGMFNTNDGFLQQPLEISPDVISEIYDGVGDYNPIPITEEWLLRFGYTLNELSGLYIFRNEVELHYNSCDFYLCEYGDWSISIKYVHELQNAYYFLIGQELTINEQ